MSSTLKISTIGIESVYLQLVVFFANIYFRPPRGWFINLKNDWSVLKLPYGLSNSERVWRMTVKSWMRSKNSFEISGVMPSTSKKFFFCKLAELSVKESSVSGGSLLVFKVVDEVLLPGSCENVIKSHNAISPKFTAKAFCTAISWFSTFFIHGIPKRSIQLQMSEYLNKFFKIQISKDCKW